MMAAHFASGVRSHNISLHNRIYTMTDTKSETMDWALWFYWIMATTLGWLAGSLLFNGIPIIISGVAIAALQWASSVQTDP